MAAVAGAMAQGAVSGFFGRVKTMTKMQDQQEKNLIQAVDEAVTLTWKQRFIGFGLCCGIGVLLTIASIPVLWSFSVVRFAIMYSVGSVLSICSTMFLMGPVAQMKRMMDEHRILATIVYIGAIIGTLVVAFTTGNAGLCLILLVVQLLALTWYVLTWIPGGQDALKALIFRG